MIDQRILDTYEQIYSIRADQLKIVAKSISNMEIAKEHLENGEEPPLGLNLDCDVFDHESRISELFKKISEYCGEDDFLKVLYRLLAISIKEESFEDSVKIRNYINYYTNKEND